MSNFYCPRIKNGIAFTPNRDYDVCGVRNLNLSSKLGIASTDVDTFLTSDYRLNLIATAEKGEWPVGCEGCMYLEKLGLTSSRLSEINLEKENGTKPLVHLNTGNVCDSDCIMCGPRWSTSIANRLKKHPDPNQNYFTLGNEGEELPFDKPSLANITKAISNAKKLKLVGGEPFIDKKLWKFLDKIARSDLKLIINTNGNTFPSSKQLETIAKFETVDVIFSIDATDLTFEWVRQNLSYKKLIKNYLKFRKLDNVSCRAICVVQAHNILNLKDLCQAFKNNINFHPLVHPSLLAAKNAPR